MLITNLISRYMKLCKAAFSAEDGVKLNKSIQTNVMEMLFLLMVIPRKCNFTQMGRYGNRGEMLSADGRAQRELARNEYVTECFRLQGG